MKSFSLGFGLVLIHIIYITECREYHYQKPQRPFLSGGTQQPQLSQQPQQPQQQILGLVPPQRTQQPKTTIIHTGGKRYEVQMISSQRIFEGHHTPHHAAYNIPLNNVPHYNSPVNNYLPPAQVPSIPVNPGGQAHFTTAAVNQNYAQHAARNVYNTQTQYAANANVAQHNTAYQTQNVAAIQPQYSANINPLLQNAHVQALQQQQPTYYNNNAQTSYAPQQQLQPAYAGAQQYGGTSSQQSQLQQQTGNRGDYVSQSEASALDFYPYKQINGDTRSFTRHINNCGSYGVQCQNVAMGPGQVDAQHQKIVSDARAIVTPVSEKCQKIAAGIAGDSRDYAGGSYYRKPELSEVRPKNRRLYEYSEIVQNDIYN
ncbi:RNA polymerase II degradation factor 1 [Teleopsis dalmanni]|uniref:RNA polymerase II degradation factor 1 n=1 Tax=Teleopsis dalmanni TaxID=139649 RepID=UPI0018CF02E1|nr:RNA polymerase II degradation factor 1 [Teleopsis dalmanni]